MEQYAFRHTTTGISLLIFIMLALLSLACVEEQELLPGEYAPPLVLEGRIGFGEPAWVRLMSGAGLSDHSGHKPVTDAVVWLGDETGRRERLFPRGDGQYRGGDITGSPGGRYTLEVTHEGKTVNGVASMPRVFAAIDSVAHRLVQDERGFTQSVIDVYFASFPAEPCYGWTRLYLRGNPGADRHFFRSPGAGRPLRQEILLTTRLTPNSVVDLEITQTEAALFDLFRELARRQAEGDISGQLPGAYGILSANLSDDTPGYFGAVRVMYRRVMIR